MTDKQHKWVPFAMAMCRIALAVAVGVVVPQRAVAQTFTPVRINAGGPAFTDSAGQVWAADKNFSGGSTYSKPATTAIAGTVDDALFRTERYGNFSYNLPVPNGTYAVTLRFAEIYWTSAGARRFNVNIEGQQVLSSFDIFVAAPGALTALDRSFQAVVTDGTLNVTFATVTDNAKLSALQVVAASGSGTPALTQVSPTSGVQGATNLAVTLTGSFTTFTSASVVTFSGSGVSAGVPTAATATSLTVPVSLTAGAALGARTVTVTTGAQVVAKTSAFTVTAGTPALTQVSPASGVQGATTLAVTLTGSFTNFTSASVVTFSGSGVSAGAPTAATATSLTVPVSLTAGAALGARTVTVTTGAQVVAKTSAFTVTGGTPALTQVSPTSGVQGATNLAVTLTGGFTNFTSASVVTFSGSGVSAGAPTAATATSLTVPVSLTAGAALGARTVTVTTGAQVVAKTSAFTVTGGTPALTQVSPTSGLQGATTLAVTLTGSFTTFTSASVVTFSGSGVSAGAPTAATATSLTVPVTLTAGAALGARTVTVTTGAQVVAATNGFTVTSPAPSSALNVRLDYVGQVPTDTNPTSPAVAGSQLLLIDQAGWIYRWDGSIAQPLLNPSLTPAGLTLLGNESVLNVAANAAGSRVYVMFTSSTVPGGIPARTSPRPGADAWQVLYRYDFNGVSLTNPAPITAFQVRSIGHTGGGLVVLNDGSLLFATGDSGDAGEDGRSYAQDASNHLSKILRIDPLTGVSVVVAIGVRNVQRLALDANGGDPHLVFADIGGRIAEELDGIRVADLLAGGPIPNFGWGRNGVDAKAREGTSYIGADGFLVGTAPIPEPGYLQPVTQFNRGSATSIAVSGPVSSTQSFSKIRYLMGDLVTGSVYGLTGPPSATGQAVAPVTLFDSNLQPVTLSGLAGGRPDPRFFTFSDGTAGVLLEATGTFYRLTELGNSPPPAFTAARANFYDNAWKTAWIDHARAIATAPGKTAGFVLQIGDSITYSSAYGLWPRQGQGKTTDDSQTVAWARATTWGAGSDKNGWFLSGAGTTAMTSLLPSEFLSGCCNSGPTTPAGPTMPTTTDPVLARQILADPIYTRNRQIDTIIAAFSDAQFAVVMLGTADPTNPNNLTDLTTIIDKLEAQHIVPILSTIPPRSDTALNQLTVQFNTGVTALARARSLPLIDFYQEILLRRPGTSWFGTLIGSDGTHPTGDRAGFTVTSNPYLPGGDPTTRTSGDALLNVGYLLRSWLTIQKLAEVKAYVIDGINPP